MHAVRVQQWVLQEHLPLFSESCPVKNTEIEWRLKKLHFLSSSPWFRDGELKGVALSESVWSRTWALAVKAGIAPIGLGQAVGWHLNPGVPFHPVSIRSQQSTASLPGAMVPSPTVAKRAEKFAWGSGEAWIIGNYDQVATDFTRNRGSRQRTWRAVTLSPS